MSNINDLPLSDVLTANTGFANDCYAVLSKNAGNVFFSPLSLHAALAMAYQGADGETAKEFADLLKFPNKETASNGYNNVMHIINNIKDVTLHMANKMYVLEDYPLLKPFQDTIIQKFLSEVESIKFLPADEAVKKINKWVEDKTNSKIKDLFLPEMFDDRSRLVIASAVYFKGNWKHTFNADFTQTVPFYVTSNDIRECQMMRIAGRYNFFESNNLDAKVLELKYKNENVSMVLLLPNNKDGITDLESKIPGVSLFELVRSLNESYVEVGLPRFKIETSMALQDVLRQMGLVLAFEEKKADFMKIAGEQLCISQVVQKAFIEVNEEGSEAAACSGILIKRPKSSRGRRVEKFYADHPFIFYVIHKHENNNINVIFSGRVMHFT